MPTTLTAGDIAIVGINGDNPDDFSFVLLVPVTSGTEITFTDSGWTSAGAFRGSEGAFKWTAPTDLPAGTVVNFIQDIAEFTSANDAVVGTNGLAVSTDGDQIIAFQGSSSAPTLLFVLSTDGNVFSANSTSSNTTSQPSVLTLDVTALARGQGAPSDTAGSGEFDNVKYSGTMTGTQAELLAAIGNAANWTGSNTALTQETANFTVTGGGADITPPSLVGTNPADDASNVSAASNIVLTFDEAVQAGTGNIVISDGAGDTRTIDVTDASQVTFSGNTVTINPDRRSQPRHRLRRDHRLRRHHRHGRQSVCRHRARRAGFHHRRRDHPGQHRHRRHRGAARGGVAAGCRGHAGRHQRRSSWCGSARSRRPAATPRSCRSIRSRTSSTSSTRPATRSRSCRSRRPARLTKTGEIDLADLTDFGGRPTRSRSRTASWRSPTATVTAGDNGYRRAVQHRAVTLQNTIEVGVLPDMLTFTPDGSKILVANEAEAISTSSNANGTHQHHRRVGRRRLGDRPDHRSASPRSTAARPRSTTRSAFRCSRARAPRPTSSRNTSRSRPDGTRAYVTLQEVNAVAVIDLTNPAATSPLAILPLGSIDRSLAGNAVRRPIGRPDRGIDIGTGRSARCCSRTRSRPSRSAARPTS